MSNLKEKTKKALDELAAFLADSPWRDAYVSQVHQLAARLDTPCVLAVAGQVKAGKSSFMNAFLKDDLALVGVKETTATINYFRYGEPPDKTKPVRCVWTDGRETWETQAFLDSLQGNTQEILERAVGIKHLEFYIPNPRLKSVQLVDTPGTNAHIGEDGAGHEKQTRGYFQMLRDRHNEESQAISRDADAVIYINSGHAFSAASVEFLQEFMGNGGGNVHNTVAIIPKIDVDDSFLENLSAHVKCQTEVINKRLPVPIPVLPISSKIQRVLDMKGELWLRSLKERLLSGFESVDRIKRVLDDNARFVGEVCRGSSLSQEERKAMCEGIEWSSFRVIARAITEKDFDEAVKYLREIAGFDAVNAVLEEQFFSRSVILRCHNILHDCRNLVWELENDGLFKYRERIKSERKEVIGFIDFIMEHPKFSEDGVGGAMRDYFARHVENDRSEELKKKLVDLRTVFENLLHGEISNVSANFDGLQMLEKHPECVTDAERAELASLFRNIADMTSQDTAALGRRQVFWRVATQTARLPERKAIAQMAERQYGVVISSLLKEVES